MEEKSSINLPEDPEEKTSEEIVSKAKEEEEDEKNDAESYQVDAGEENDNNQDDNDDNDDENSDNDNQEGEGEDDEEVRRKRKKKVHRLSLTKTEDFNEKLRKRGVVYLSRIPPRMNPAKVKQLLGAFGTITRVFLQQEDASVRKRRRKAGGSGAKRYTEGWVEFERKKVAKHVAQSLNNTEISNQKRNVHYGDLWNIKYLHKFKWEHLTEKVAYERRVREQKLRVEMMQARKENAAYTQLVETGKKLDKIAERKRKRGEADSVAGERNHSRKQPRQTQPVDAADKSAKRALLNSLV